jgi:hypothetical protein
MKKETFVALLDGIQAQDEADDRFSEDIGKHMAEGFHAPNYRTMLINVVLDALVTEMDDDSENISYYCYETEFGKKADQFFITFKDGRVFKFKTASDVYDYLTME